MATVWNSFKDWLSRVKSVWTPWGGVAWKPRAERDGEELPSDAVEASVDEEVDEAAEPTEAEEEVLCAVANRDDSCVSAEDLADELRCSDVRAEHLLERLEEQGFLESYSDNQGTHWYSLSRSGRKYLVEQDLVD